MSNEKAIATIDATTTRVVESVILRGDISGLSNEERARYYVQLCESMGLNPASQPFAPLRLNGKEILYPTRTTTDQLAKIHKVNREITDGPRLIDLGGTKLIYALCRATMPDGRFETATATVPFTDPMNVLMKCETKAKRRATLSILGLGMLDETEIESIPASAKDDATPIDLHASPSQFVQRIHAIAEAGYGDAALTAEQAAGVYWDAISEAADKPTTSDDAADGVATCIALMERGIPKAAFNRAWEAEKAKRTKPAPVAVETTAVAQVPAALAEFNAAINEIELPAEGVAVWLKHRDALATLAPKERDAAWKTICARVEVVGGVKNAKVWLKRAIALEDTRRKTAATADDPQDAPVAYRDEVPATAVELPPMESFCAAIDAAHEVSADAIARAWVTTRLLRVAFDEGEREHAWKYTQDAYGLLVNVRDAVALRNMLKANIARHEPHDDGPRGGSKPTATEHTTATGETVDSAARSEQLQALHRYLATCTHGQHALNGVESHRSEWPALTVEELRAAAIDRAGQLQLKSKAA